MKTEDELRKQIDLYERKIKHNQIIINNLGNASLQAIPIYQDTLEMQKEIRTLNWVLNEN